MGGCLQNQSINTKAPLKNSPQPNNNKIGLMPHPSSNPNPQKNHINLYRLKNDQNQRCIKFNNAPLINCKYLYNKFHHDNQSSDQLNLQWQIQTTQYNWNNNSLKVWLINRLPVNLWVVIGGQSQKNITGLYSQIKNYQYCQMQLIAVRNSMSLVQRVSSFPYAFNIPVKFTSDKFYLILESVSNPNQSLCLINSYVILANGSRLGEEIDLNYNISGNKADINVKLIKQQLMWNTLAFQIANIYNQDQLNLKQGEKQIQCVICSQNVANCILASCKHMCICKQCIASFRKAYKVCPLCKKQYSQIILYDEINR